MGAIFGRRLLAIQLPMITRTYLRPYTAIRYSWKNILFSATCAGRCVVLRRTSHRVQGGGAAAAGGHPGHGAGHHPRLPERIGL